MLEKHEEENDSSLNLTYGLRNFKSFKEKEYINIKPLTILCGVNNCGKSSLIQSLLLLSQSISQVKEGSELPFIILPESFITEDVKYKTSLLFEGEKCHLSDYFNVLNKYTEENEIDFSFAFNDIKFSITFANVSKISVMEAFVKEFTITGKNYELKTSANFDINNRIQNYTCLITIMSFKDFILQTPFKFMLDTEEEDELDEIFITNYRIKNLHVKFNGFIPESLLLPAKNIKEQIEKIFKNFGGEKKSIKHIKKFIDKNSKYLFYQLGDTSEREDLQAKYAILNFRNLNFILNFFINIHYIGPLRDEPHRYYQFFDIRELKIGNKGQNAPQILTLQSDSEIPPIKIFEIKNNQIIYSDFKCKDLNLQKGLAKWFEIIGLPDINPELVEDILFKIMVNLLKKDTNVSLQDVGFGISQILPVYIESLRMDNKHTLILEQPEIHLHPKMQSNLADFLLCMMLSGKNFIIETHSEYLINRICLRIAQDQNNFLKDKISIVFIEPPEGDEEKGFEGSKINRIILNNYGEIENWPIGFFDEMDYNKILKAAINKRINEKS